MPTTTEHIRRSQAMGYVWGMEDVLDLQGQLPAVEFSNFYLDYHDTLKAAWDAFTKDRPEVRQLVKVHAAMGTEIHAWNE